jgi:cyclic-di-GMP-binding protein
MLSSSRQLAAPADTGHSSGIRLISISTAIPVSMASNASFDVSTGADLQEVDNAVNQALKEIAQRYDFKGTHCTIEFDRPKAEIRLSADDEYRMEALVDVLKTKMIKRNVPIKNLDLGELQPATGQSVRRTIKLTQGIPQDISKRMVKAIKDQGFKKVQTAIQGEELRVTAPSRDELQAVIAFLRGQDFGVELKFGNYRG